MIGLIRSANTKYEHDKAGGGHGAREDEVVDVVMMKINDDDAADDPLPITNRLQHLGRSRFQYCVITPNKNCARS